jgi:hypothetical protein
MRLRALLPWGVAFSLFVALGCGDGPCPEGYEEKDDHCVPAAIVDQCHFVGNSEADEACSGTDDCNGCFIVCLEQVCFVQLDGGATCVRDAECKSARCEASLCAE